MAKSQADRLMAKLNAFDNPTEKTKVRYCPVAKADLFCNGVCKGCQQKRY